MLGLLGTVVGMMKTFLRLPTVIFPGQATY
ncbi:MAG: hypothetical protein ACLT38_02295 [Akkermansia sp.]